MVSPSPSPRRWREPQERRKRSRKVSRLCFCCAKVFFVLCSFSYFHEFNSNVERGGGRRSISYGSILATRLKRTLGL